MNLYMNEAEINDLQIILDPHSLGSFHVSALSQSLVNFMTGYDPLSLTEALRKLDLDHDGKLQVDELRYFVEKYGDEL